MTNWDPALYKDKHHYVADYGNEVVRLLNPQPDEIILDLGCGTGELTHAIAEDGAVVTGLDSSAKMIECAKKSFPALNFLVKDAQNFEFDCQFDAVFSNAVLHWMPEPTKVLHSVYQCLKPGGRFAFEMGGKGNLSHLLQAVSTASKEFNITDFSLINYYPTLGEYACLLEHQGFQIIYASHFDRLTPLMGSEGLINWVQMFRGSILDQLPNVKVKPFLHRVEELAADTLYREGRWLADYVRLRMLAIKL